MRSKIRVPPADKMSARHIAAFAKAAAFHNARILLENGLRISPDGTVDRPGELQHADSSGPSDERKRRSTDPAQREG